MLRYLLAGTPRADPVFVAMFVVHAGVNVPATESFAQARRKPPMSRLCSTPTHSAAQPGTARRAPGESGTAVHTGLLPLKVRRRAKRYGLSPMNADASGPLP